MRLSTALLSLLLLASACGGTADPKALTTTAYQELGAGNLAAAEAHFSEALAAMGGDTSNPEYLRAKLGHIETLARTEGKAAEAKTQFLALAESMKGKVTDKHYNQIGSQLGSAGAFNEATAVLAAGKKAYPESTYLDTLLRTLGDKAKASGDSAALEALKGLGYVGD